MLVFFCVMRIIDLNMDKKFYKNEKFQKIFYAILYLVCAFAFVISGCYIFYKTYYSNVYVSGTSMSPTLIGGNVDGRNHYGISDNHRTAINNLKRFDVVITYYPSQWTGTDEDTVYKIKRVWGFPGETINLVSNKEGSTFTVSRGGEVVYTIEAQIKEKQVDKISSIETMLVYQYVIPSKEFNTHITGKYTKSETGELNVTEITGGARNINNLTLGENQYFVMGDNWIDSTDCYTKMSNAEKLTRNDIQGRVICIQGYGKVVKQDINVYKIVDKNPIRPIYNF